jgi:hypothetical protein
MLRALLAWVHPNLVAQLLSAINANAPITTYATSGMRPRNLPIGASQCRRRGHNAQTTQAAAIKEPKTTKCQ